MPRSSKPVPADIPGWPGPARLAAAELPPPVVEAAVLLARWTAEVRQAMWEEDLTQQEVATSTATGLRTVSRVLNGQAWPELPTLVALSTVTGVPLPGARDPFDPVLGWPECLRCDDDLRADAIVPTPTPAAAYRVVVANHGHAWTGMYCLWIDRLRDSRFEPALPPTELDRWVVPSDEPPVLHRDAGMRTARRSPVEW